MESTDRTYQGMQRLRDLGFVPTGILDVGAYNGDWSRGIRAIFPEAYLLMIDGLAEKEGPLREACAEIGNADFKIALVGAEERDSTSFFVVHAGDVQTGSSKFKENTNIRTEERRVPQITLNSLLGQLTGRQFQLIKLDVQGAELEVLGGCGMYLHRAEAVMMEVATLQYNRGAPLVVDVLPRMQALGFVLFDILDEIRLPNRCLLQFDALFVRPDSNFRPHPPFQW